MHKGQWSGALRFSMICAWTNGSANNRDASDLRPSHSLWHHCNTPFKLVQWYVSTAELIDELVLLLYDCEKIEDHPGELQEKISRYKEYVSVFPWDYQLVAQWYYWFLLRVCWLLIYADDVAGFWIALCLRIPWSNRDEYPSPKADRPMCFKWQPGILLICQLVVSITTFLFQCLGYTK